MTTIKGSFTCRYLPEDGTSVSIASTKVEYAVGSNGTTAPTSGWQESVPSVANGSYLWTRVTVVYSDGNQTISYSTARMGLNGTSITIVEKSVTYAVTSSSTQPTTFPYDTMPSVALGQYLWSRTYVEYSDGNTTETFSVARVGADGEGQPGADSFVHLAYSTSADGSENFSTTYFDGALYIGICTDHNSADPTSYTSYTWARLKGEKGDDAYYLTVKSSQNDYSTAYIDEGVYLNGTLIRTQPNRGHVLLIINPSTQEWAAEFYDTYADATAMDTALASIGSDVIVCLATHDASGLSETARGYLQQMGSDSSATWTATRMAHVFIGQKGLMQGQAYEATAAGTTGYTYKTAYFTADGLQPNSSADSVYSVVSEMENFSINTNETYKEFEWKWRVLKGKEYLPYTKFRADYVSSTPALHSSLLFTDDYDYANNYRESLLQAMAPSILSAGTYQVLYNITISDVTPNVVIQKYLTITIVADGEQGLQGMITRTSEWVSGQNYRNDEALTTMPRYLDVVMVENDDAPSGYNAYRCLQTHDSDSTNAPGSSTGYWEELSGYSGIYASLVVAKNTYTKNLTVAHLAATNDGNSGLFAGVDESGYPYLYALKDGVTVWKISLDGYLNTADNFYFAFLDSSYCFMKYAIQTSGQQYTLTFYAYLHVTNNGTGPITFTTDGTFLEVKASDGPYNKYEPATDEATTTATDTESTTYFTSVLTLEANVTINVGATGTLAFSGERSFFSESLISTSAKVRFTGYYQGTQIAYYLGEMSTARKEVINPVEVGTKYHYHDGIAEVYT